MTTQRDIPRSIARVLAGLGLIWAFFLALPTIATFFIRGAWPFSIYLVCGYAVWFGWYWRSRRHPPRRLSIAIWISSIVVNLVWLVALVVADGERAFHGFLFDEQAFYFWWQLAVAIASAVALFFEFRILEDENAA